MVDRVKLGKKSNRKGKAYERKVARDMSKFTGQTWKRTPHSGAGHIPGDIMRLPEPFEYTIELKNRKDLTLDRVFKNPNVLQPYMEDKQILIFNNHGQSLVVLSVDIVTSSFGKLYSCITTSLKVGGDWYIMSTLKDLCACIKENE